MFLDFNKDGKYGLDDLKATVWGIPVYLLLALVGGGVYYFFGQKGKKRFRF